MLRNAAIISAVLTLSACLCLTAKAAPYTPVNDAQALETLPSAGNATLRALRQLHAELARQPDNLPLALQAAQQDIEAARSEADPRYHGFAEAALRPWLALQEPPPPVLLLRAVLRQAVHDFPAALGDLDRVIAADPRNAQARLIRAVILQVQGDYPAARKACLSLAVFSEPLLTTDCVASVGSLSGQAQASRTALLAALEMAPAEETPQLRLWGLTILAETEARTGMADAADAHFREAIGLGLRDAYLLGAYADFLLDTGRPQDVLSLLRNEQRIDPLLLRLALAEQALGGPGLSAHKADLAERFGRARQRGDTAHRREEARFTLHVLADPPAALALALANWAAQREPADTRILLEAAVAAKAPAAARPALDWLAEVKLEDRVINQLAARLSERAQ